jgi:hypothetical protein
MKLVLETSGGDEEQQFYYSPDRHLRTESQQIGMQIMRHQNAFSINEMDLTAIVCYLLQRDYRCGI